MFDRNRNALEAPAVSPFSFCGALGTIVLVLGVVNAKAQDAEPRSYSNTPVGLNFLIAGHVYSEGKMAFDPDLSIADATFHSNTELLAYGPWTFEVPASVTFFSDNTDFFGGNTFAQAPIYAVQVHLLYTFPSGMWMALDGVYFAGGHTSLNGVESDNEQRNTRAGFTLALPIDRRNSLKLPASTGISTRTGSEFTAVGVAWQYRWGGGY